MASIGISRELLASYEGLNISDICTAVRFVDDEKNHCAHFVNHVLGFDTRLSCGQLLGRRGPAANIRVHETFAQCPSVGRFEDRPTDTPCLAFLIHRAAVDLSTQHMTNLPKKHIGILCDGEIWHYSNARRKVVRESPEQFSKHFSGDGFGLFFGTFPEGTRALLPPSVSAGAPDTTTTATAPPTPSIAAPTLKSGQRDNVDVAVWQQFLLVRQLLSGPNLRRLLDGHFGPKTKEATEAFQISAGLPETGVVDGATYAAAIKTGFIPRVNAPKRQPLTQAQVSTSMTKAAIDALHRLGPSHVFYTEEVVDVGEAQVVARLEPHKHTSGTQLRFWHRGITLYAFKGEPIVDDETEDDDAMDTMEMPPSAAGHAGMDTSVYPGDELMAHFRTTTNLEWTGFYLGPAPSHKDEGWMNRRSVLRAQGWGLAPIYVGQQLNGPGSHDVRGPRGLTDGDDAVALARKAEFPEGSVLYLDIETGGPLPDEMKAYLKSWCTRVEAGNFVPGAYLSHTSVDSALSVVPDLVVWIFKVRFANSGIDIDPPFRAEPVSESRVPHASVWQWAQNCKIPKPGKRQLVDLNVASSADPSKV